MTLDERFLFALVISAVITFSCRLVGFLIGTYLGEVGTLKRVLDLLPTCAIGAVLGPILVTASLHQAIALGVSASVFLVTSKFFLSLCLGTIVLLLSQYF